MSKGQETSIYSTWPFAVYWLLGQVLCSSLQAHKNIIFWHCMSLSPCCHHARILTAHKYVFLRPPWTSCSGWIPTLGLLESFAGLLHSVEYVTCALNTNHDQSTPGLIKGEPSSPPHSMFKLHVMNSWSHARLIIDALKEPNASDVTYKLVV